MKNFLFKMILGCILLFSLSFSVQAQIFVKVRPTVTFSERPMRPSQQHVWIGDEWTPNGDTYRNVGGHWAIPPHQGNRWRAGHWRRHGRDGEAWVGGRWGR